MKSRNEKPHVVHEFALPPIPPRAWWVLVVIWLALLALAWLRPGPYAAPPTYGWAWLVPIFGCALVVIGPFVWMQHRRIALVDGTLVIEAGMQTRKLDAATLDLEHARVLDLDEHTEFGPRLKLMGVGLPGLRYGSFLLRNRRRAFCLLIGTDKALLLPLRGTGKLRESLVLLTPSRPRALLEALRDEQARHTR